ncbi:MAG: T6SS immunity protein Tdi1 domain-containing protein [Christensenellales bacterium]
MSNCISKFIEKFKPVVNLQKPDEEILNFGKQMLPKEIIELWEEYGFGEYGDGLLKVVDPREYMNSLYTWLGQKDFNKIPIIVTAFGDIFYYRKLEDNENDVSLLNIHYRKVEACGYSYQEFFEKYILDEDIIKNVLRADLYKQAVKELGKLDYKDIFFFIPALVLGGREELKYIKKGNGAVHHQVLLQIGQEE